MVISMKVGRNQVFKDGGCWAVELYEYSNGSTPMYSYFDCFETKKQAVAIAKILNVNNQNRIRDKLMDNPNYLA